MKKGFLYFAFCFALLMFIIPQSSHAYLTKSQSAEMLKDGKGVLYSVTYDFGSEIYDFYIPIVPERNGVRENQTRTMTYAFVDEDNRESKLGESIGVVVSDAEIRNGYYFVPKGKAKSFTLITLLRLPQTLVYEPFDLSLLVTNLPFEMKYKGGDVSGQLNPSELQYYRTPSIKN